MSRPKIGVIIHCDRRPGVISRRDIERLRTLGDVVLTEKAEPLTDAEAIEILRDCQVALGSWDTPKPNEAILAGCPKLKLWVHAAGTVKGHFGPHMKGRDMKIATCKGAIADNVAEIAVAQVVMGLRVNQLVTLVQGEDPCAAGPDSDGDGISNVCDFANDAPALAPAAHAVLVALLGLAGWRASRGRAKA